MRYLPGLVTASLRLGATVTGVPVKGSSLDGVDWAIRYTVSYVWQSVRIHIPHHVSAYGLTPSSTPWQREIPVAMANGPTVAINNRTVAGLFAVRILAAGYLENSE